MGPSFFARKTRSLMKGVVTETWIKLGEYCNRKISECREQLEDLEVALNRMEERDLA